MKLLREPVLKGQVLRGSTEGQVLWRQYYGSRPAGSLTLWIIVHKSEVRGLKTFPIGGGPCTLSAGRLQGLGGNHSVPF